MPVLLMIMLVSKSTITDANVRTTTYANVDGAYNFYGRVNYSKDIEMDTLRTLKYDLSMGMSGNRDVNFNNEILYASKTIQYMPRIGLRFTWKNLFEIRPEYGPTFTRNTYDLASFDNNHFKRQELRVRTSTFWPKELQWENDIRFIANPSVAGGFQTNSVFWNSTLAYSILKDQGTVTLKAYDILNQNTNAQRTATADYVQDVQSTVLQRYFMLSFSYRFNTLGKKGEIRDNNWFD